MKTKNNQYFRIKSVTILLTLTLLFPMSIPSCNDERFLEEKVYDMLLTNNAFGTVEGIKQGVAGMYQYVRNSWYWGEENQDPIAIWLGGLGTDICFFGEDPAQGRWLTNYPSYIVPANSPSGSQGGATTTVHYFWDRPFRLIQRANYVIQACEDLAPEKWKADGQKEAYIAEAKFFRAWAYRHLVSFFGAVPVIDEPTTGPRTDYPRDPVEKAYTLMEADLSAGTTALPRPGAEENKGRLTQGAAWQLLCEVYLAQKKYQDAVTAATHVINDYGYQLMKERFGGKNSVWGTGDVYWDLFANGNQNNAEAIWIFQMKAGTADGNANHRGGRCWGPAYHRLPDVNPRVGKNTDGDFVVVFDKAINYMNGTTDNLYTDTLGRGVSWIRPTNLTTYFIWKGNWDNDIRNARHNILRDFYYYNPGTPNHVKKIDFKNYDYDRRYTGVNKETGVDESLDAAGKAQRMRNDTCQYIFPFFLKKFDPCNVQTNVATAGNGDTFKDIYVMRLAETYLSRAEAYIGLGQLDKAAEDINAVRTRAKANPVDAGDVNIDYLLDERARELYGEECRHIVLRRTGTLLDRVRRYNNNPVRPVGSGQNIMKKHLLWPIPQSEIDLNQKDKWEQNPGYDPSHPDYNVI